MAARQRQVGHGVDRGHRSMAGAGWILVEEQVVEISERTLQDAMAHAAECLTTKCDMGHWREDLILLATEVERLRLIEREAARLILANTHDSVTGDGSQRLVNAFVPLKNALARPDSLTEHGA